MVQLDIDHWPSMHRGTAKPEQYRCWQDAPGSTIEPPIERNAAGPIDFAGFIVPLRHVSEKPAGPFVGSRKGSRVAHGKTRLSHSRVTTSRSLRRSAGQTSQCGFSKLSAVSIMM